MRDSVLTRLLQDALGGGTRAVVIATASAAQDAYDETAPRRVRAACHASQRSASTRSSTTAAARQGERDRASAQAAPGREQRARTPSPSPIRRPGRPTADPSRRPRPRPSSAPSAPRHARTLEGASNGRRERAQMAELGAATVPLSPQRRPPAGGPRPQVHRPPSDRRPPCRRPSAPQKCAGAPPAARARASPCPRRADGGNAPRSLPKKRSPDDRHTGASAARLASTGRSSGRRGARPPVLLQQRRRRTAHGGGSGRRSSGYGTQGLTGRRLARLRDHGRRRRRPHPTVSSSGSRQPLPRLAAAAARAGSAAAAVGRPEAARLQALLDACEAAGVAGGADAVFGRRPVTAASCTRPAALRRVLST